MEHNHGNHNFDPSSSAFTSKTEGTLIFILVFWMILGSIGYTIVESTLTRKHHRRFVYYRNAACMFVVFVMYRLIG